MITTSIYPSISQVETCLLMSYKKLFILSVVADFQVIFAHQFVQTKEMNLIIPAFTLNSFRRSFWPSIRVSSLYLKLLNNTFETENISGLEIVLVILYLINYSGYLV